MQAEEDELRKLAGKRLEKRRNFAVGVASDLHVRGAKWSIRLR
jgi:hypothetical protein